MYIINGKTTRDHDLDELEQRSRGNDMNYKRQIDHIYHQTKDNRVEEIRWKLIEAHKQGNLDEVDRLERILAQYGR